MDPTPISPTIPPGLFPIDAKTVSAFWQGSPLAQVSQFIPSITDFFDFNIIVAKIKFVSFIVSVIFSFVFMVILLKLRRLYAEQAIADAQKIAEKSQSGTRAVQGPYRARWDEIQKHMDSAKEAEWKFAVIEADKLADLLLQRAGFPGDTMGERLMSVKDGQLISLQDLWDAHKIRNNLAHSVDYFLRYSEAKQAIDKYERFFQEMGVL